MDIPQAAIDAAQEAIRRLYADDALDAERFAAFVTRVLLEAAAPHLSGACALHGDLDQSVILAAVSDPGAITPRGTVRHGVDESVAHWQMRAVVASLTRPDPAIPTGGTA